MISLKIYLVFLFIKISSSDQLKVNKEPVNKCEEFYSWKYLLNTTHQFKIFTLQDASAKNVIPTGLLHGNIYDLGNFDECYSIKDFFLGEEYYGKYCLGTLSLETIKNFIPPLNKSELRILNVDKYSIGIHYAYCLPNFCTIEDFQQRSFFKKVSFNPHFCYSKNNEESLSTGAICTISLITVFLLIVLTSSLYENYLLHNEDEEGKPRKPAHEILVAFSVIRNWPKIFQPSTKKDQLLCLNGMKAISMMWIICYHEFQNQFMDIWNNGWDVINYISDWKNMYILQGTVSVDTFLAVSGLLLVYNFMKSADKGIKYNPIMTYIHRYFRLTPVVLIWVLIHLFLLNYMGNGPLWNYVDELLIKNCQNYWWSALLYIQTYVNTTRNCVPQTWYLSVDMQLFILAPLLLVPLKKWPKPTLTLMALLVFLQMIIVFTMTYFNDFPASGYVFHPKQDDYQATLYFQTYARYGPYVLGMMTGYIIYHIKTNKLRLKLDPFIVTIIWFVVLAGLLGVLFGAHDIIKGQDRVLEHSFFNAFFRISWAICICVAAILCIANYGGPINAFLSLPVFQIISNLSYCMYLVHYSIVIVRLARKTEQYSFGNASLAFSFWGDFAMSFVLSVICCLTFEIPFITVEKYLVQGVQSLIGNNGKKN